MTRKTSFRFRKVRKWFPSGAVGCGWNQSHPSTPFIHPTSIGFAYGPFRQPTIRRLLPVQNSRFVWMAAQPLAVLLRTVPGAWSALCESANINVLLHDFRRTAVRNLIRAGVSRAVRRISGHETDSIFSRYNITEESDLADAARKLEVSRKLVAASAE